MFTYIAELEKHSAAKAIKYIYGTLLYICNGDKTVLLRYILSKMPTY